MRINTKTQAKIDVVEKWVERFGRIWSRKFLYILVKEGLVKETSKNQYTEVSKLFTRLRREGHIPYEWFRDKKTEVINVGIGKSDSFDESFKSLYRWFGKDSKSMQKYYVEVWTEKELPDDVIKTIRTYECGLLTSEGFVGDVAQHDALLRFTRIKQRFPNMKIKIIYITDYDCEGEHIYNLMKEKFEKYGIDITKLLMSKDDVRTFNLVSNIGYRNRMMKPSILEHHLCKEYVKEFFAKNTDLAPDGIVQYELDAYPTDKLIEVVGKAISELINYDIIKNTAEICKKEADEWVKKHYKE